MKWIIPILGGLLAHLWHSMCVLYFIPFSLHAPNIKHVAKLFGWGFRNGDRCWCHPFVYRLQNGQFVGVDVIQEVDVPATNLFVVKIGFNQ